MGDPKKCRKKYAKPSHPWRKERIDAEKQLFNDFGLKNRKEIWKAKSVLDVYRRQVKEIISGAEADSSEALLSKLRSIGLIKDDSRLDDVLSLQVKDFLERRLQTVMVRRAMAKSMKQARQFITHNHMLVDGKVITSPSFIVHKSVEEKIAYNPRSSLSSPDHPEFIPKKEAAKEGAAKKHETTS